MNRSHARLAVITGLGAALAALSLAASGGAGARARQLADRHDRRRRRARRGRFRRLRIPRAALRGSPDWRLALAPAAAAGLLERRPRCDPVRAELPAEAEPVPAAGSPVRGLPVPERVHADVAPRRKAAGARVDPRRRLHRRTAPSTTTAPSSRPDGTVVVTINYRLGALGFLAHPALASRPRRPGRQLRPDGSAGGAALGQAQHRAVRRRPAQRDDRRPVGRRRVGARPARLARLARAVPAGDRARAARSR